MNQLLDTLFIRTTPTPESFLASAVLWILVAAIAASYLPRIARWLTDRDLEQLDDDELADDLDFVRVDHGVIP
ncbi:membrane protein [Gordonia phage Mcklovin]|uniref:Membrane protein n=1 Tax=Gordonia phage Mcklovin TaxID=2652881 RepID=A0A5P8DCV9_9CAUD|nr:membrane protein [Gordonia phage Mcklovin]QFP96834.1 membrane protein [Gordonia phage Mcklovin]